MVQADISAILNMKPYKYLILISLLILALTAAAELGMGRLAWGPDGHFGWWEGSIWSNEQSQRLADPYSLTHIIHGILFYALLWLVARKLPKRYRFVIAILLEAAWEILENSSFIINRYRAVTVSLGYFGDSVLNSLSDIGMMALGFLIASRARVWVSVGAIVIMELGMLLLVRDNLTLNIIMLIHPIEAIKQWQLAAPGAVM